MKTLSTANRFGIQPQDWMKQKTKPLNFKRREAIPTWMLICQYCQHQDKCQDPAKCETYSYLFKPTSKP